MGLSKTIILAPHILQLFIYFLYVVLTVNFDSVILMESELSFLVIRAQPPMPSWSAMLKDHFCNSLL